MTTLADAGARPLDRKPIFDEVRRLLGRGFTTSEVKRLDLAIDRAQGAIVVEGHRLGALSEKYESGGRGPGTVSSGRGDPGGVSYGTYQLASRTGTAGAFVAAEGQPWARSFGNLSPGSDTFNQVWRTIAQREPDAFAAAQHAFIKRTHYDPAVQKVRDATGVDLDTMPLAVRDATWSVAVQHGGAAKILTGAVRKVPTLEPRALLEAIYADRAAYVRRVKLPPKTLRSLLDRYDEELRDALEMLEREGQ